MDVTLPGSVMPARLQPMNAPAPILFTVSGTWYDTPAFPAG